MVDFKLETNYPCSYAPIEGVMGMQLFGGKKLCKLHP
jgi:hypothetical protein